MPRLKPAEERRAHWGHCWPLSFSPLSLQPHGQSWEWSCLLCRGKTAFERRNEKNAADVMLHSMYLGNGQPGLEMTSQLSRLLFQLLTSEPEGHTHGHTHAERKCACVFLRRSLHFASVLIKSRCYTNWCRSYYITMFKNCIALKSTTAKIWHICRTY